MTHWMRPVNLLFDLLFWPFRAADPAWPLLVFAALTAVLMVLAFRWTSNPAAVRRAKERMAAHVMEVRLFQEQLGVVLGAYGRILRASGAYLRSTAKPLALMLVPLVVILVQLDQRLGIAPAAPGRDILLKAKLAEGVSVDEVELRLPEGVAATAPALRIAEEREVDWRLRAARGGEFAVEVVARNAPYAKQIVAGSGLTAAESVRARGLWGYFLHPGEPPLPGSGPLESIAVNYAARDVSVFGWRMHWLIPFLVFSILVGYVIKGWLGAEF
jgi:hypothetical protein